MVHVLKMNITIKQIVKPPVFKCRNVSNRYSQIPIISSQFVNFIQRQNYCTPNTVDTESRCTLPPLMNFPKLPKPYYFTNVWNRLFGNIIIKLRFDENFVIKDFIEASKYAVQVVSENLKESDFSALEGLVTKNAIAELKTSVSKLTVSQRCQLAIKKDDILSASLYQLNMLVDETDRQWVQITMCYDVLKGVSDLFSTLENERDNQTIKRYQIKPILLNYRFVKEFTKGNEDSWHIDVVNHYEYKSDPYTSV